MRNNYRDDTRERYRRRERKIRKMYRRRIFVVFVLALVLGILLGWIGCAKLGKNSGIQTPAPTPEVIFEPEITPWADPDVDEPEVSLEDWEDTDDPDIADFGAFEAIEDTDESDDWADWDAEETFGFEDEETSFGEEDVFGAEDSEELPFDVTDENPFELAEGEDPFAGFEEEFSSIEVEVTEEPTEEPTPEPTAEPTPEPTEEPTPEPTEEPTSEPTEEPTPEPTEEPTPEPTEEPTPEPTEEPTPEPTEEPTPEPTEEPTPEPTEEPTPEPEVAAEPVTGDSDMPVNLGEEFSFTMQVLADGAPRADASVAEYFDVPVTVSLTRHMDTQYYVDNYSTSYQLRGDEACCELKVVIGDCEGINTFSLQDALPMVLVDAEGNVIPGYQFRNAEIGGETESQVATGSSATVYKRYSATDEVTPVSLLVTYYVDGQMQEVYFSLTEIVEEPAEGDEESSEEPVEETAPEATAEPAEEVYTIGSSGQEVMKMQNKLIQLGYLSGVGDGEFGKWTAAAVKEAQEDFGLEVTGVADRAFLDVLYSK